jgi:membrane-bound serine protease (ClpP class)
VVGVICLILAFYSFQVLPVNYAGIALLILGLVLLILEVKVTSFGALAIGGIISIVLGALMLFDTNVPALKISKPFVITMTIAIAGFFLLVLKAVWSTHRNKPFTGEQEMLYAAGESLTDVHDTGTVMLHGERWNACSDNPIPAHSRIRVIQIDGLKLKVEKYS